MSYIIVRPYTDPSMQRLLSWTRDMLVASAPTAELIGCSDGAVVAQAAQETGWGRAAIGNNVFGIKADAGWKGARQLRRTWEVFDGKAVSVDAWFRDYPTLAEGIMDHFIFLKENKRYANVFDPTGTMSDEEYFYRLADDGYATDPNYARNLCAVLDSVNALKERMSSDSFVPPPPLLLVGSSGPDVARLQTFLGLPASGAFDSATKDAVVRYQAAHKLVADGIVGPMTRASMKI
jgi:hypothetical protein